MRRLCICFGAASGIAALLLLSLLYAQSRGDRRTILDLEFHEGTDMEVSPSPDGRHLALQLWSQIWILDTDTGNARLLTDAITRPDEHWYPHWSPDGASVVFSSLRSDGGLFVVPASGGEPRQLTFHEFDFWPAWSPDGRTIVFQRAASGLWTIPSLGGSPQQIKTTAGGARSPALSPDGRWLACIWQGRVTVMASDGSSVRQVTKGPQDQAPSWSPDGGQLFFLSAKSGELQIWSVPVEGVEPARLTDERDLSGYAPQWMPGRNVLVFVAGGKIHTLDIKTGTRGSIPFSARMRMERQDYRRRPPELPKPGQRLAVHGICDPAPSPDGRKIAFSALGDLWLRDENGTVEQLTSGPENDVEPAWSPDGLQLVFASNRSGDYQVWTLALAGRVKRQVTAVAGHAARPVWQPSGKNIIFLQSSRPMAQSAISIVPASGGDPRTVVPAGAAMGMRPLGWFFEDQSLVYEQLVYDPNTGILTTRVKRARLDGSIVSWTADPPDQVEFSALSTQGDTLAYVSNGELWSRSLVPEKGSERRLVQGGVFFPAWSPDRTLVYVSAGKLMQVNPRTGEHRTLPVRLSYEIPRAAESLLLRNAHLRTPESLEGLWDVLLANGRIESIFPAGKNNVHAGRTMDLEGRFMIPGLLNLHEHLPPGDRTSGFSYWGVTSVATAGEEGHWLLGQQEAIRSGRLEGPRLFPSGGFVVPTQMNAFPQFLRVKTLDQLNRHLDHLGELGATHVKAFDRREPWVEAATISAAHQRGLAVLSHFLRPASVAAGLDRKEHTHYYGVDGGIRIPFAQDTLEILRKADITISSTLVWAFVQSEEGRARLKAAFARTDVADCLLPSQAEYVRRSLEKPSPQAALYDRALKLAMANTVAAHEAGIRIVAGTDYHFLVPGLHWELELLVRAGLSPLEALRTATSTAAAALDLKGQLGSILPGAVADLVVLEADPLVDIRNTQKICAVIQGGRIVDRASILSAAGAAQFFENCNPSIKSDPGTGASRQ
jgi:Tol biopolymer transport system component